MELVDDVEAERRRMVGAALAANAAEPRHHLSWTCPLGCGQEWRVEVPLRHLERGATQLVNTIRRHQCKSEATYEPVEE